MILRLLKLLPLYSGLVLISLISPSCVKKNQDNSILESNDYGNEIQAVAALGQLTPKGEVRRLAAPFSGFGGTPRVSKIFVKEGDSVEIGNTLVIFDNRNRALADLNIAKALLNTLEIEIKRQKVEVGRYQKAALEGAISLVLYERKKDRLINLEGQRDQVKEEIVGFNYDLDQSKLRSPINGVILRIMAREGERPGSEGVLEVGDNTKMEALVEVYESDVERVKLGQIVNLTSENGGFSGTLLGQVSLISPQVRQRRVLSTDPTGDADARVVEVRVSLVPQSVERVKSLTGMKVIALFEPF